MSEENVLLMPFLDASESLDRHLCHTVMQEQIKMICKTFAVPCEFETYDDEWSYVTTHSVKIN